MKPGTTERFDCDNCQTEFEVTLEPKERGYAPAPDSAAAKTRDADSQRVTCCPFCSSTAIVSED